WSWAAPARPCSSCCRPRACCCRSSSWACPTPSSTTPAARRCWPRPGSMRPASAPRSRGAGRWTATSAPCSAPRADSPWMPGGKVAMPGPEPGGAAGAMPVQPAAASQAPGAQRGMDRLPWITYRFRLLGMGLGGVCIGAVLHENGAAPPVWALLAFTALLWPHLALLIARRSTSPYRAERRNLLLDSAQTGFWVAMMQFNLLPSVLLFTLVTVDKISSGIPRLWLWSLPAFAAGLLCGALATGFAVRLDTSMTVLLLSMPVLTIHTIAVALASNRMGQKIRDKNRLLDELSRTDSLTGLHVRRYWLEQADRALRRHRDEGAPMALLLLDIDHFKVA